MCPYPSVLIFLYKTINDKIVLLFLDIQILMAGDAQHVKMWQCVSPMCTNASARKLANQHGSPATPLTAVERSADVNVPPLAAPIHATSYAIPDHALNVLPTWRGNACVGRQLRLCAVALCPCWGVRRRVGSCWTVLCMYAKESVMTMLARSAKSKYHKVIGSINTNIRLK